MRKYDNITKIVTGQGHDYTIGCLLNHPYFKELYKMIVIYLRKQQALDVDPKAIQQINFIGKLRRTEGATIFFIIEESKKIILDFPQGAMRVFCFNIRSV